MARGGAKKRPFYRIVVAENSSPRDGRFIERLGHYNPLLSADNPERVVLNKERILYWLGQGAKPSDRVEQFLGKENVIVVPKKPATPKKSSPKKKAQERLKAENEARKAAEEAAEKARQDALQSRAGHEPEPTESTENAAEAPKDEASEKPTPTSEEPQPTL
jgi:small subunit ribosomal protein S16